MERLGILNIEVLNRTATMLLDQDKKGQAVEVLLRSYRLWPEQEVLKPILDVVRGKRPKVAFFRCGSGEDGVLADVCEFVQQRFTTEFHAGTDSGRLAELMQWGDICWFDGGGEMLVEASRRVERKKMIVSLRRCDIRRPLGQTGPVGERGYPGCRSAARPWRRRCCPRCLISAIGRAWWSCRTA